MFDVKKVKFYGEETPKTSDSKEVVYDTTSGNGSLKLSSTGNPFVDDFGTIAKYRQPREIKEVFRTMEELWSINPILCLKESVYLRMITRDTKLFDGVKVKSIGQGLKAEFFSRLMWLAVYQPETFKKNLALFIAAGSWDDIFELMRLDLSYEHDGNKYKRALDWKFLGDFIIKGLKDPEQRELIKKFMPTIKAAKYCTTKRSQCSNYIGKWLARLLFGSEDKVKANIQYQKLKSSGTAHEWQKLISQKKFDKLDFSKIPGRALSILANGKFLSNHGLEEEFAKWVLNQPQAKFTGFVYELFKSAKKDYQKELINRQFMTLVDKAKEQQDRTKFICCLDTSGSMESACYGLPNTTSLNVARSIALYFSYLLDSQFSGYLEFADEVELMNWEGETPYDKFFNREYGTWGSTNFLGVADWFVNLKKGMNLSEDVFPNGVICVSDGEFNDYANQFDSNFKEFKRRLATVFSQEFVDNFKLVLWDIPNTFYRTQPESKFESLADEPNFFYISGFDPAGIQFLLKKTPADKPAPKTAEELFEAAMNQELLNLLRV